jgi:hypothetical protein
LILFALAPLLWASGPVQSEESPPLFRVVYVEGVILKPNGNPLQVGDRIRRDEPLKYPQENALAAIFHPRFGRVLLPETDALRRTVTVTTITGPISLRNSSLIDSLNGRLARSRFLLLGEAEGRIDFFFGNRGSGASSLEVVDAERRAQLAVSKFYLLYQVKGQPVKKELQFNNFLMKEDYDYQLRFKRSDFLTDAQGQPIGPEEVEGLYRLYLVPPKRDEARQVYLRGETPVQLAVLEPVLLADEEPLRQEVGVVLRAMAAAGVSTAQQRVIVQRWLARELATPLPENLDAWLSKNFGFAWP